MFLGNAGPVHWSDVTRGWPLFDREPHYVYFHEPASMLRQLQLSIALVKLAFTLSS